MKKKIKELTELNKYYVIKNKKLNKELEEIKSNIERLAIERLEKLLSKEREKINETLIEAQTEIIGLKSRLDTINKLSDKNFLFLLILYLTFCF